MKTKIIIAILFSAIILSGCGEYDRIDAIPGVYVNESSVNMLVGDKVQLQASPMAGVYTWKSVDPSVASVSQTGEVTAVTAGSTDIIVMKSGQDDVQAQVSVNIRDRIYLDNIKLNPSALEISSLGATVQVLAVTEPSIITVPYDPIVWTSDNPQIATVNANGLVTSVGRGVTKIRAGSGDIESVIDVTVYQIQMSDRTQFSIASVSDQTEWDGGGVNVILQQFDTWMTQDRFWHSKWDGGAAPCPHWVVIDMGKERTISTIEIFRRFNNSDTKTVQSYVGNDPDPNASSWTLFGENQFPSRNNWDWGNVDGTIYMLRATHSANGLKNMKKGHYLKIVLPDSWNNPFTSLSQVRVWEVLE